MPLIQLDKVSLAYGHVPLLDQASLVLEPGERVGLIGRNGTGKSSLLKVIAAQTLPDDGKVWRAPNLAVAYVPQEPVLDPSHTVFEAVAEGLGEVRVIRTRIWTCLWSACSIYRARLKLKMAGACKAALKWY